jgi:5'-AMP-activated protein kinase regulatory gamma subunit
MLASRARRIPLVDFDDETKRATVVSVITQYRILKFVAVNVKETQMLKKPLKELPLGSYTDLATASMDTPVIDVIHMLVNKNISSVPILDNKDGELAVTVGGKYCANYEVGTVINVFEAVDVIALIKGGLYEDLDLTVGEALLKRSDVRTQTTSSLVWILTHLSGFCGHIHMLHP